MKKHVVISLLLLCAVACLAVPALARVEHTLLKDIALEDTPKDIILSRDGSTAYILGEKSIMLYALQENKVTDTIPLNKPFTRLALSPDESLVYLTAPEAKQVAVMQIAVINNIETGKSPVIGNPKAPVTVAAFLDFQCPYCVKAYPLLKELLAKYPKDVKLVIKHYPLPFHKFAEKAAIASLAAARQNKYDKVVDLFFTNSASLSDETIRKYVQDAGADMQKYDKDIADPEIKAILQQDLEAVRQTKVRGVPAIFINGVREKGRSIEAFSQMVEEELKKKK